MADIPEATVTRGDMWQPLWKTVTNRWQQALYVLSGGYAAPGTGMHLAVDECVTPYGTTAANPALDVDAAHASLARVDVLYVYSDGFHLLKGVNAAIDDRLASYNPTTHANWQQLWNPIPRADVPAGGIPLYEVFVAAGVTGLLATDLIPVAAKGIVTSSTWIWESLTGAGTAQTLAHSPVTNSITLFRNGMMIEEGSGNGYTRTGANVTLTTARDSDSIRAHYQY